MARLEGPEVFKTLAERFPRLELERDVEYERVQPPRALESLPVCWE
jgi:hypothetical protein